MGRSSNSGQQKTTARLYTSHDLNPSPGPSGVWEKHFPLISFHSASGKSPIVLSWNLVRATKLLLTNHEGRTWQWGSFVGTERARKKDILRIAANSIKPRWNRTNTDPVKNLLGLLYKTGSKFDCRCCKNNMLLFRLSTFLFVTSRFVYLDKFSLNFSSSLFVIRANLLRP